MITLRTNTINPFLSTQRAMDELIDTVFEAPFGVLHGEGATLPYRMFGPPLNIWEDENALYVECELPGFEMNDIELTVLKNRLTISGRRSFNVPENATVIRRERTGEEFSRTIDLPSQVDFDKAAAQFEHGILRVTLPKQEQAKPRRIEVRSA